MPNPQNNPQLTELLQLAQVFGALSEPQRQQEQLEQQDQRARLTAAIQLMGLQQEQESQRAMTALKERDLAETATTRKSAQETDLKLGVLREVLGDPQVPADIKTEFARRLSPELGEAISGAEAKRRGSAIETLIPSLQALKDDTARGALRPQVAQYPGAFEEAMAKAFPPVTAPASGVPLPVGPPGYFPGLGTTIGQELKYAPVETARLGGSIFNQLLMPPANLVNSLLGLPPIQRAPLVPRDYEQVFANLLKPQPR